MFISCNVEKIRGIFLLIMIYRPVTPDTAVVYCSKRFIPHHKYNWYDSSMPSFLFRRIDKFSRLSNRVKIILGRCSRCCPISRHLFPGSLLLISFRGKNFIDQNHSTDVSSSVFQLHIEDLWSRNRAQRSLKAPSLDAWHIFRVSSVASWPSLNSRTQ